MNAPLNFQQTRQDILLQKITGACETKFKNSGNGVMLRTFQGEIVYMNAEVMEMFGLTTDVTHFNCHAVLKGGEGCPTRRALEMPKKIFSGKSGELERSSITINNGNGGDPIAVLETFKNTTVESIEGDDRFKLLKSFGHNIRTPLNYITGSTGLLLLKDIYDKNSEIKESLLSISEVSKMILKSIEGFNEVKTDQPIKQLKEELIKTLYSITQNIETIVVSLEVIRKNLSEEDIVHYDTILEGTSIISNIVTKAKFFLDIDKNDIQTDFQKISVPEIISSSQEKLKLKAKEKKVDVTTNIDGYYNILADSHLIESVVANILDNAIKFSPPNSSVEISTMTSDNKLQISISDKGDGIDPFWLSEMFNQFAIYDPNDPDQGLGLSMAMVKKIVELHNGSIIANSALGVGTTFIIELPLAIETNDFRNQSFSDLVSIVESTSFNEDPSKAEMALDAIADIGGEKSAVFLINSVHHEHATVREKVHHIIIDRMSLIATPLIMQRFSNGNNDTKIMWVDILGKLSSKSAKIGKFLLEELSKTKNDNLKFTIYQAIGNADTSVFVITTLVNDFFHEKNEAYLLYAMASSLSKHSFLESSQIKEKILSFYKEADKNQRNKIQYAIISSKSTKLFDILYFNEDKSIGDELINSIEQLGRPYIIKFFVEHLESIDDEEFRVPIQHIGKLSNLLSSPETLSERKKNILVVDDSATIRLLLTNTIKEQGVNCIEATSGNEALQILEKAKAEGITLDGITLDVNMPEMNGLEFLQRASVLYDLPPVVVITTEKSTQLRMMLSKFPNVTFVQKSNDFASDLHPFLKKINK